MTTPIKTVAVCGAGGTMGAGIALVAARAGFRTLCYDTHSGGLASARKRAERFFDTSVERGKMSAEQRDAALANLVDTTELDLLSQADLVIEAVYENLQAKRELLQKLNAICGSETIFASNTSTLSITEIAAGCGREDRVVGMHFCLPAELMKLIEMSRGINTSEAAFQSAWQFTLAAGQKPVETQDKPGFILNALLVPFNNDVIRAVEAGLAAPGDIDTAIKVALGYKMGPCELIDLIGLDTQVRLCEAFYPVTLDPRASAPPLLRRMAAAGRLGRKAGRGLFEYSRDEYSRQEPAVRGAKRDYAIRANGESRSFPDGDAFLRDASEDADILVVLNGGDFDAQGKTAVLVELDLECLGVHTAENSGNEGSNVLGFARYRNGNDAPSNLIELVRQPRSCPDAIEAAKLMFEAAGFVVVTCADQPGRIVDRLVRPKYNAALKLLDEGLATAEAMDMTCRMGLGYPDGPIERVERGGLARHHDVSLSIFQMTGHLPYMPARRAVVAKAREAAR